MISSVGGDISQLHFLPDIGHTWTLRHLLIKLIKLCSDICASYHSEYLRIDAVLIRQICPSTLRLNCKVCEFSGCFGLMHLVGSAYPFLPKNR